MVTESKIDKATRFSNKIVTDITEAFHKCLEFDNVQSYDQFLLWKKSLENAGLVLEASVVSIEKEIDVSSSFLSDLNFNELINSLNKFGHFLKNSLDSEKFSHLMKKFRIDEDNHRNEIEKIVATSNFHIIRFIEGMSLLEKILIFSALRSEKPKVH